MTTYLWIYDDTPKRAMDAKLENALGLYRSRAGVPATVILCNPSDAPAQAPTGVLVRPAANVGRNNFWVGREDV